MVVISNYFSESEEVMQPITSSRIGASPGKRVGFYLSFISQLVQALGGDPYIFAE